MSTPDPKLEAWRRNRTRLDVVKTVTYNRIDREKTFISKDEQGNAKKVRVRKNHGLPASGKVTFRNDGRCPCSGECGHTYMYECEEADCKCCTSVCN